MFGFDKSGRSFAEDGPKFKAGDTVRVLVDEWAPDAGIGKTGVVHEVLSPPNFTDGVTVKIDGGDGFDWFFKPGEIELIHNFPPGTHLRLKIHTATLAAGDIVTVTEPDAYGVYATDTNGRSHYVKNEELEIAPDCAERKVEQGITVTGGVLSRGGVTIDFNSGHMIIPAAEQPCIVALISKGKPRPSTHPYLHASVEAATAEAERLAKNNPGQEFAVFQRVAGRIAEVSYTMKEVA